LKEEDSLQINEQVKISEYSPSLFEVVREMDNVASKDILGSLDAAKNRQQVFKAKESAGKSGSFFFFSYDRRFLIKTMNNSELEVFINCLPDYV